jgi:predicted lipid carrier protein YhbT
MVALPSFVVPGPVGAVLSRLPAYPGAVLLVTALNLALARQIPADVGQLLHKKRLRVHVRDARVTFDFVWKGRRFLASTAHAVADLTISANAFDFLQLAQREEDPDTLFFNRRLSMEGDTELGLVVKNTMDALELPILDLQQWLPQTVLARWNVRAAAGQGDRSAELTP